MLGSWSVRISLFAVLLLVLGPLLAFLGLVPGLWGFFAFSLGALVGFIGVLAGIVTAVRGKPQAGLVAVGLGLGAMLVVLLPAFGGEGRPRINDISTDLEDVPSFTEAATQPENQGKDLAYPEAFKPIVREAYPKLAPLRVGAPPDEVLSQAAALAREQPGWQVTSVDTQGRTFEGVAETRLFRFRDDFVVRVRPEGEGTRVDMRSRSRVGRGDFGANALRIERFLQALASRVGAGTANPEAGR